MKHNSNKATFGPNKLEVLPPRPLSLLEGQGEKLCYCFSARELYSPFLQGRLLRAKHASDKASFV